MAFLFDIKIGISMNKLIWIVCVSLLSLAVEAQEIVDADKTKTDNNPTVENSLSIATEQKVDEALLYDPLLGRPAWPELEHFIAMPNKNSCLRDVTSSFQNTLDAASSSWDATIIESEKQYREFRQSSYAFSGSYGPFKAKGSFLSSSEQSNTRNEIIVVSRFVGYFQPIFLEEFKLPRKRSFNVEDCGTSYVSGTVFGREFEMKYTVLVETGESVESKKAEINAKISVAKGSASASAQFSSFATSMTSMSKTTMKITQKGPNDAVPDSVELAKSYMVKVSDMSDKTIPFWPIERIITQYGSRYLSGLKEFDTRVVALSLLTEPYRRINNAYIQQKNLVGAGFKAFRIYLDEDYYQDNALRLNAHLVVLESEAKKCLLQKDSDIWKPACTEIKNFALARNFCSGRTPPPGCIDVDAGTLPQKLEMPSNSEESQLVNTIRDDEQMIVTVEQGGVCREYFSDCKNADCHWRWALGHFEFTVNRNPKEQSKYFSRGEAYQGMSFQGPGTITARIWKKRALNNKPHDDYCVANPNTGAKGPIVNYLITKKSIDE